MLENKKKILVWTIIGIIVLTGGIVYYFLQNGDEKYLEFEDNLNTFTNAQNIEGSEIENKEKLETASIVVHIAGQVVNPGVISLKEGSRIIDAINAAGGTTEEADLSKINLAYILKDAQKIYIPSVTENEELSYILEASTQASIIKDETDAKDGEKIMININTASITELQKIPGIGQTIASRIIEYRKENGKFNSIEDIQKVSGIGSSKFNNIKKYICVK